jgi:hypothetical protein
VVRILIRASHSALGVIAAQMETGTDPALTSMDQCILQLPGTCSIHFVNTPKKPTGSSPVPPYQDSHRYLRSPNLASNQGPVEPGLVSPEGVLEHGVHDASPPAKDWKRETLRAQWKMMEAGETPWPAMRIVIGNDR